MHKAKHKRAHALCFHMYEIRAHRLSRLATTELTYIGRNQKKVAKQKQVEVHISHVHFILSKVADIFF